MSFDKDTIKNEILMMSYWEHFKALKEISRVYPINHPKRIEIQSEVDRLLILINTNE